MTERARTRATCAPDSRPCRSKHMYTRARSRAHRGTIPKRFVEDWMRRFAESGVGGFGAFRGDCGGVLGVDVSGVFSANRAASAVRPSTVNLKVVSVSLAFLNNKTR